MKHWQFSKIHSTVHSTS